MQGHLLRERYPYRAHRLFSLSVSPNTDASFGAVQINLQIAKQGYRLAAWLNVLIDGATNLP